MSDKELFMAALDVPVTEASRFVTERAVDAEQARRVDELLQAHRAAGPFLAMPTKEAAATLAMKEVSLKFIQDQPGQIIAERYKLVECIGEGGMGTVWMAEQLEPIRRLVAVKLIKPGMDTRQVLARFEAERQALALMDHPNIARIHDGGTLPDGRPFFIMELVKGIPVTQYCDERQLAITDRLQLFLHICHAVQHAHQKGILHRDLKPGNLLVTEHDGKPVPKVIDFGLAKAIGQESVLTEQTLHTAFGTVVGTPLYMAPEQVALNALDIDTRADIYSLGVVLYELLTGTTPLERERFRTSAWEEVKRLIREEEPPKPSTRLSSSDALPSIASRRHSEPAQLGRFIKGELDWIVMKTLEKDRNRRYATANALAEDVNRFLNHEAVLAGPPSAIYKVRKFARRYRGPVLAAGAMLVLLVAGVVGTTWGMLSAWKEQERAQLAEQAERTQKEQAQYEAGKSAAVVDFLQNDLLGHAALDIQSKGVDERTADLKVRTLLDRASVKIDGKFAGVPYTEVALRLTIGSAYESLGLYDDAEKHFLRAVALSEKHAGTDHEMSIRARSHLAHLRERQGKYGEAARMRAHAAELVTRTKGATHPDTLLERLHEAKVMNEQRKAVEAEKLVREVLTHIDQLPPLSVAMAQHELARALQLQGHLTEAEPFFRQALAVRLKELGADHHDVVANEENLALNLTELGKLAEAEAIYRRLIDLKAAKLGADHPDTLVARGNFAILLKNMGKLDEAIALYKEVLQLKIKKHGPDHPTTLGTRYNLGIVLHDLKRLSEAESLYEENLGYCITKLGPSHVNTLMTKMQLAQVYSALKKYAQAEPYFRECLAAKDKHRMLNAHPIVLEVNVGHVLFMQEKYAEAEPFLLSSFTKIQPDSNKAFLSQKSRVANWLAVLYEKTGKNEEAARWREEAKRWATASPRVEKAK